MSHPINFLSLDRADRQRQHYDSAYIRTLAESIYTYGFIHPLCINPDTNRLIAGGCRSAALDFILANPDHFESEPHPSIATFLLDHLLIHGIHYTSKTPENEQEHATLELVENVIRHNLSWQEEVLAIKRIHQLKSTEAATKFDQWTQKRTGALLGIAQTTVSYCLLIADELNNPDSPCWKHSSIMEAYQYLAKQRHDESSQELIRRIQQRASIIPDLPTSKPISGPSFISTFDPSKFVAGGVQPIDPGAEFSSAPAETKATLAKDLLEEAYGVVTKLVHHMRFEEFCKQVEPESFDHVLCDPPYAINMKNLAQENTGQANIDRVEDTHNVEQNMADFPIWLEGCYRIMKPKGFCIWFCDQAQWQYLYDLAIKTGFKVQRWPFVWCKTSVCMNQQASYNFTKATEIAMVMRKGDARLITAQGTNYWLGANTPEDKAAGVNHPFIKPKELWQHLLKAIALPGSTIVDGFSGVGSSTRAMMLAGYTPVGVEMDVNHYSQQIQNLAKVYCDLKGNK